MEYLLTADEMSQADRYTSEVIGIPPLVLMERAALGVAAAVRTDVPQPGPKSRIAVVAGKGNNGADAVAAGRILLDAGYEVRFFLVSRQNGAGNADTGQIRSEGGFTNFRLQSETAMDTQLRILRAYGRQAVIFTEQEFVAFRPDIILDGLFGTGLAREVAEPYAGAVRLMNQAKEGIGSRIYSVDIPSGIDGTTGRVMGCAVQADVTVTFAFYKRGHFLYPGCTFCGKMILQEIGITRRSLAAEPGMFTYREEKASDLLPQRSPDGNKGTFGKVLVIAGSKGVSGACTMCAQAVLRMGAGMVKVFTHESNRVILQEIVPEAMCSTYGEEAQYDSQAVKNDAENPAVCDSSAGTGFRGDDLQAMERDLAWADVVAVGPGMGLDEGAARILSAVLDHMTAVGSSGTGAGRRIGLVIDADAVRLIAQHGLYGRLREASRAAQVILTPHLAECAALLRMDIRQLQAQRMVKAREFADSYSCTLVIKDARTLVVSQSSPKMYLNTSGNDGLSTAGSGDVLTGITASCLAQFLAGEAGAVPDPLAGFRAGCAACYIHGRAAETITEQMSRRSLCATDLISVLQQ